MDKTFVEQIEAEIGPSQVPALCRKAIKQLHALSPVVAEMPCPTPRKRTPKKRSPAPTPSSHNTSTSQEQQQQESNGNNNNSEVETYRLKKHYTHAITELRRLDKEMWEERVAALDLVLETLRQAPMDFWTDKRVSGLKFVKPLIEDLRSSVVRKACEVVEEMSQVFGRKMDRGNLNLFLEALFSRVFVTIKIIRESCRDCILTLVHRSGSGKCLDAVLRAVNDTHVKVRVLGTECLGILVMNLSEEEVGAVVPDVVKLGVDASADVRDRIKDVFSGIRDKYPMVSEKILETASVKTRKLVLGDEYIK